MQQTRMILLNALAQLDTRSVSPSLNSKSDMMATMMKVKVLIKKAMEATRNDEDRIREGTGWVFEEDASGVTGKSN